MAGVADFAVPEVELSNTDWLELVGMHIAAAGLTVVAVDLGGTTVNMAGCRYCYYTMKRLGVKTDTAEQLHNSKTDYNNLCDL